MKKINYKFLIPVSLVLFLVIAACSKSFINKPPLGTLSPSILASETGVQGLLIGAYSLVDGAGAAGDGTQSGTSNWPWGGVASDDAYKGSDPSDDADVAALEDWSIIPTNGSLTSKWVVNYAGIQRCNDVLKVMRIATGISDSGSIAGQARFLRAFYHIELQKVFGNIVYADESISPTNINFTNTAPVWPSIEGDLNFAIANLPDNWSSTGEVGRANVWAAKALLAKAYMFQQKYAAAYTLLQDIIANGKTAKGDKYALNQHYFSNFNPAQKNSPESVFAAQTSVQDGSSVDWGGTPNGDYGDLLNFPYTAGPGACCGFYNPSQDLANAYKTDATTGLPLLDTYFQGLNVSDPTTPYVGTLDPRIDWAIGRKGIPYLDWGPHPGDAWIRNPGADGHFSPKKNVYAASQKNFTDNGSAYWAPTELVANNINLIRFADVILWAAECAAQAGDLNAAMGYVNQVRTRAANPTGWVYSNSDYDAANAIYKTQTTPADNYKIGLYTSFPSQAYALEAIYHERRIELSMEGHRFFDLVRWGIAGTVLNAYYDRFRATMPLKKNAHWTAGKNEHVPIPQSEIDNVNSDGKKRLVQNPGY